MWISEIFGDSFFGGEVEAIVEGFTTSLARTSASGAKKEVSLCRRVRVGSSETGLRKGP
jgi:hypothetical protein